MQKEDKIYIAGHRGMVGSAIVLTLKKNGFENLVLKTSSELDLRNQSAVLTFFEKEKPDYVFLAAAKVGGIQANNIYRADFLFDNLSIQNHVIHAAWKTNVKKLMFLGSSCIYPKFAEQPISEESLLTGSLEQTNEPYAIAKIAGLKLCEAFRDQYGCDFISLMPTNLYGPNDNYHPENSHVLPALIRKFHHAVKNNESEVYIWGDGSPKREFLHVDDLAEACLYFMLNYSDRQHLNIGTGEDLSIKELAEMIQEISGFSGKLTFDSSKPNGTPRKVMNVNKMKNLGFSPKISLKDGISTVYSEYAELNQ